MAYARDEVSWVAQGRFISGYLLMGMEALQGKLLSNKDDQWFARGRVRGKTLEARTGMLLAY